MGYSGAGTFTQTGGTNNIITINLQNGSLVLGSYAGGSGTYNLSGNGLLSASYENVGYSGTGTFTQTGGTNSVGDLYLGNLYPGYVNVGTYNLNGGLLIPSSMGQGPGTVAFNFNGGTLRAGSSFSTTLPMALGTSGSGATFDTAGFTVALSGSLSGPGSLTKIGSGTLALSGSNVYSGGTTINTGTLLATSPTSLPGYSESGSVSVAPGAVLAVQIGTAGWTSGEVDALLADTTWVSKTSTFGIDTTNGNLAYNGSVTQPVALAKLGPNTLTLTGSNTYTGGTTVISGMLIAGSKSALGVNSGLTVASSASFAYQPALAGALNLGSGALMLANNSTIGSGPGRDCGPIGDFHVGYGVAHRQYHADVWGIPGTAPATGTNRLITAGSGLNTGTLVLGNVYNATNFSLGGFTRSPTAVSVTVTSQAPLANLYWSGGFSGGNNVWGVSNGLTVKGSSNWTTNAAGTTATSLVPGPTTTVNFSASGAADQGATVLGVNMSIAGLAVNDTASVALGADGNALAIGGKGITVNSTAGAVTLNVPMTMSASETWTNNALNPLDDRRRSNQWRESAHGGWIREYHGLRRISGTGGLTMSGGGALTISNTNSFTGPVTFGSGTIAVPFLALGGHNSPLGAGTSLVFNGGALEYTGSDAVPATDRTVALNAGGNAFQVDDLSTSLTLNGVISGSGNLTKAGPGTLALAGVNTYTGNTIVNGGVLNLAHPLAAQYSTVNVSSGGALGFAAGIVNPTLGGLAGAGNVALATAASEPVTLSVGQNGQNTTYSGILSGPGGLTKQGAGNLTLTASQSYNGPTVIDGGVLKLQLGAGASIGIHFQGNDNSIVTGSAGVVAMSNWNNLAGAYFTNTALVDNSAAATTAHLTVYAAGVRNSGSSNQLLNGYIYDDSYNRLTATISGIPYASYSLYAYMADANTNGIGEKMTIGVSTYYYDMTNSGSYKQVTNTDLGKHPKGNYVVATGLTGNSQTVIVQGDTQQYGSFTGFEIVDTSPEGADYLPIASSLTIAGSGALDLGGVSQQVAALSGAGTVTSSNTAAVSVLTLSPTGGSTTFSGVIQGGSGLGAISLVMSGSGTQVLAGSNAYTGGTTILSGRLMVDGSLASHVSVDGGTLGGSGSLGSVTVNAGGRLAPGNSPGLRVSGNLVLASGAAMDYELDTPSTSDMVYVGNLALNLQQFSNFNFAYGSDFGPGNYNLIEFGSSSGSLGATTDGAIDGYPARLAVKGNDLLLTVVPEPSTLALLGVAAIGLLGYLTNRKAGPL